MESKIRRGTALVLALPVLALTACGSDDKPLPKAELAAQADTICKKYNLKGATLLQTSDLRKSNSSALATYLQRSAVIVSDKEQALSDLRADDDAQAAWDAYLTVLRRQVAALKASPTALFDGPGAEKKVLADLRNVGRRVVKAADKTGAEFCGSKTAQTTDTAQTTPTATAPTATTPATTVADTPLPTPTGTLDKAALGDAANEICKTTNSLSKAVPAPPNGATDEVVGAYYGQIADLAARQQAALEKLRPAAAVKADWKKLMALTSEATALVQDVPAAARVGDKAKGSEISDKIDVLAKQINPRADALGARGCGSDSGN